MNESSDANDPISVWEKHFLVKPEEVAFDYHFFDLYSGDEKKLLAHLRETLTKLKRPDLSGPIYLIIRELLTNSLKAVYKKLYLEYFIQEMGLGDLSYEEWLMIFKTEIETHMADNFSNMCRDKDMFVECMIKLDIGDLVIEISNEGAPSDIEWKRLQESLARASEIKDMSYLFEEDTTADDYQEGAGIGVPMILMMLKNIRNNNLGDFNIKVDNGKTVARLNLPVAVFMDSNSENETQKVPT
ncbi:MAG: hypothetical protein ABUK01_13820 [Leptospirales bacterium]